MTDPRDGPVKAIHFPTVTFDGTRMPITVRADGKAIGNIYRGGDRGAHSFCYRSRAGFISRDFESLRDCKIAAAEFALWDAQ